MDSYEGLIDSPMTGNPSSIADYQVPSSFPQFQDGSNMNSSYGNLAGLSSTFSGNSTTPGSGLNMSGYNTSGSQSSYGNMSSGSSSSFSMPYDPPTMQQGSTPHLQMAAQPSNHSSQGGPTKTIHSCTYCGLVLSSANALVEHKRIHTGDRPFSCHICNKKFTQKAHLNIHKRIHTGEKPYACHICQKRFAQSSHLSSHKRIHTGEKPFVCEICHIGFTQKQRLDTHLKKHLDRGAEGITKPGNLTGSPGQMEQFRQGQAATDDSAFIQMIGHGMPYIKQEAGLIGDSAASSGSNSRGGSSISTRSNESTLRPGEQAGRGHHYRRGRNKRNKTDDVIKEEENDDGSGIGNHEKSPQISAPSFSSEGMFLHPSGYVAYGNIEDSEESNDQSPGSNATESTNQQGGGTTSSAGHRRKPTVVRKRYSESPAKEPLTSVTVNTNNNISDFQHFSPLQNSITHGHDNSDGEMDESGTEEFYDTGEMLDDKNDPPYPGNRLRKPGTPGVATRHAPQINANAAVETRSHSRRNIGQALHRPHQELLNGDRLSPMAQKSGLTYSGHSNTISNSGLVKVNNRISLINFTAEELITHLMKRDDVHKCQFCCLIFQDAAMYHIHRNMHDKADIRRCNMCGKLLQDKYDFTAHFLNMHQN